MQHREIHNSSQMLKCCRHSPILLVFSLLPVMRSTINEKQKWSSIFSWVQNYFTLYSNVLSSIISHFQSTSIHFSDVAVNLLTPRTCSIHWSFLLCFVFCFLHTSSLLSLVSLSLS